VIRDWFGSILALERAASYAGESESATQKAVAGIVPTLVAALTNLASTSSGAQELTRMLDTGRYDGSALDNLGSLFSGAATTQNAVGAGNEILESLFGSKLINDTEDGRAKNRRTELVVEKR
jgi:hypothetical protein